MFPEWGLIFSKWEYFGRLKVPLLHRYAIMIWQKKSDAKANRTWTIFVKPHYLINPTYLPIHHLGFHNFSVVCNIIVIICINCRWPLPHAVCEHAPSSHDPPISYTEVYVFGICLSINIMIVTLIRVPRSMSDANIFREYHIPWRATVHVGFQDIGRAQDTRSKTSGFNMCSANVLKRDMDRCSPVDAVPTINIIIPWK